jgi:DNA-binding transcriptional ArsR family regulator
MSTLDDSRRRVTDQTCVRPAADGADAVEQLGGLRRDALANDHLVALAAFMTAAGNETRLRIMYVLWRAGRLCVCDLADVFEITQPAMSRHLRLLREKALVVPSRNAQTIFYSVYAENPFARLLMRLFEEQAVDGVTLALPSDV